MNLTLTPGNFPLTSERDHCGWMMRGSARDRMRIRRAEQKLAGAIAIRCGSIRGSLRGVTVMTMPDGRACR